MHVRHRYNSWLKLWFVFRLVRNTTATWKYGRDPMAEGHLKNQPAIKDSKFTSKQYLLKYIPSYNVDQIMKRNMLNIRRITLLESEWPVEIWLVCSTNLKISKKNLLHIQFFMMSRITITSSSPNFYYAWLEILLCFKIWTIFEAKFKKNLASHSWHWF
jgi:hypothetical protein